MENKNAVVYIRVSTEDQKDGLSPDVQKSLCLKRAEEAKYEVIEVIDESGISGFKERSGIKKIHQYIIAQWELRIFNRWNPAYGSVGNSVAKSRAKDLQRD